ncbi:Protein-glutamate methylesterase/protein-glutamine glutaminase [Streptomyces violaceorubidus]
MTATSGTPDATASAAPRGTTRAAAPIGVLVVDDDFMVARVHRAFVERVEPFRVVGAAGTGEQALTAVAELRPDLVLLDLYLPDVFGLDVIPRLRAAGHDCDVMVISAAREADAVRGAVRHGVVDYLLKPFEFEDLRVRLERYAVLRAGCSARWCAARPTIDRVLAGAAAPAAPAPTLPKGMSVETAGLRADPARGRRHPVRQRVRGADRHLPVSAATWSTSTPWAVRRSPCATGRRAAPSAAPLGRGHRPGAPTRRPCMTKSRNRVTRG